jgi:hypothetical protein
MIEELLGEHSLPSFRYFWRLEDSLDHLPFRLLIIANIDCLDRQPWIRPGFQVPFVTGPHDATLRHLNIKSGPQRLDRSFQKPWQLQFPLLLPTWTPGTTDLYLTRSNRINVSDANRAFIPAVDGPIFADASRAQSLVRVLKLKLFVPIRVVLDWMNADRLRRSAMIHRVRDLIAHNTPWVQFDRAKSSLPENGGFPGTQFVLDPLRSAHKYGMDRDHWVEFRIQESGFSSQEREPPSKI